MTTINTLFLAGVKITADPHTGVAQNVDFGGATLTNLNAEDCVTRENVEHVVDGKLTGTTNNIADLQLQIAQLQALVSQLVNQHGDASTIIAQGNYNAILNAPRPPGVPLPYLINP